MKVTFPFWGNYTLAFEKLAKKLGLEIISPEPTSSKAIEEGVKISPEMYCFPLKVNIGNFLEAIKKGADTVIMPTALKGSCRLRYYPFVQEKILKEQGKEVEFIVFDQSLKSIYRKIRQLANLSFWEISNTLVFFLLLLKTIDELEKQSWFLRPRETKRGETDNFLNLAFSQLARVETIKELLRMKKEILKGFRKINYKKMALPKVGIVGEIYTVCDFAVNFQIERKLGNLGIEVHRELTLLYHLKKRVLPWIDLRVALGAKKYLKSGVGGHGREAVYEMLYYHKKGFDGIIQLLPAMCLPGETNITVENYLQKPIKEIKVGEKVLTHKGRFKKVIKVFRRNYQGKMLKIDCGGKSLTLSITPEHKVLLAPAELNSNNCVKKIGDPKFTPASKAKKGDFLTIPNEIKNKKFLSKISSVRLRELPDYFLVPIRKIEVIDFDGPVYNLAVEDDHSYVANFLAVKNCMPETSVRPILEKIHQEMGIPFLSLSIDEQTGEAGIETRLEAFSDVVFNYFSKKRK